MKKLLTLTIASLLIISPVAVVNAQQHGDKKPMSMGMMDEAKMEKMQQHMSKMKTLLGEVKSETDPEKRQELLHKHAQSMGDMMAMMHGENKGMGHSMDKQNMDKMRKSEAMPSEQNMEMMEKRMAMMEQMMEQVMGHTAEESKMVHEHKQ
ncbi:MAG: protein CpxP [Paraglaciecola sp.]|jgi:protein CpxP